MPMKLRWSKPATSGCTQSRRSACEAPEKVHAPCGCASKSYDAARQPALARHLGALENRAFVLRWSSGSERPLASGFEAWSDVIVRGLEARARALRRPAKQISAKARAVQK